MMSSSSSSDQVVMGKGSVIAGCGAEGLTEEQFRGWKCIYPNYIDKSKSTKQGRRLSHAKSVERPTVGEMLEIVQKYGIPFVLENKAYSRDWLIRGRIRVNLSDVKDETVNTTPSVETKLMQQMASEIPSLKSRTERLAKEAAHLEALERNKEKEAKKASKGKKK